MQVICRPGSGLGVQVLKAPLCVWEFLVLVGHIEILDKLKQRTNTHFCMKNFIDQ